MRRVLQVAGRQTAKRSLAGSQARLDEHPVAMPALSPTMESGTIKEWLVKPGDTVGEGDELCLVETDKAVVSFETMQEGVIAKILMDGGSKDVKVGEVIAVMVDEGDDWENVKYVATSETVAAPAPATPAPVPVPEVKLGPSSGMVFPSVRLLAAQYGISDISSIPATGPKGAVTKGDALAHIEKNGLTKIDFTPKPEISKPASTQKQPITPPVSAPPAVSAPVSSSNYNDVEITQMRSIIAKRLTESKTQIAHQYTKVTCEMDNVAALRAQLKSQGVKVSVNDFIIKSVAAALTKHPTVNQGAKGITPDVDVSVAVATEAGLITPIVKNADQRGLSNISSTVRDLATRARDKKLLPEEFMGGSFTISNLGMFGIKEFSAVINPPQVCIMAVGGNKQKFVQPAGSDPEDMDNLELRNFMTVQLSSDGQKVSQQEVIAFLETFKKNMENPVNMIV